MQYTVAPDGYGDESLWRFASPDDDRPELVARRHDLDPMDPVIWTTLTEFLVQEPNPTAPRADYGSLTEITGR